MSASNFTFSFMNIHTVTIINTTTSISIIDIITIMTYY